MAEEWKEISKSKTLSKRPEIVIEQVIPPFPQRDLVLLFQVNRLKSTTLAKNLTRQDNGSRQNGDHGESCELPLLKK